MTGTDPAPADFEALIRLFRRAEGGRAGATFNCVRWTFEYALSQPPGPRYAIRLDFFDAQGDSLRQDDALPIGIEIPARVSLAADPMRERLHRARIRDGVRFYCYEGERRVGAGRVTRVIGLLPDEPHDGGYIAESPAPMTISVVNLRHVLHRVLAFYGLPAQTLEIVPSVFEWCRQRGVAEDDPDRMSRSFCDPDTGECRIVIRASISQRDFDEVNFAMEFRGFFDEVRKLTSLKANLLRLLLYEIACHTLRTTDAAPRDRWAFEQLDRHADLMRTP